MSRKRKAGMEEDEEKCKHGHGARNRYQEDNEFAEARIGIMMRMRK